MIKRGRPCHRCAYPTWECEMPYGINFVCERCLLEGYHSHEGRFVVTIYTARPPWPDGGYVDG